MQGDLTTLGNVKGWLGSTGANAAVDPILSRLITSASRWALNYLDRDSFAVQTVTETYDGYGKDYMLLRQWPAISITSVAFDDGKLISTPGAYATPTSGRIDGYLLQPPAGNIAQPLTLIGSYFPRRRNAVTVTYTFGWQQPEPWVVPAGLSIQPLSMFLADGGVAYATGAALVKVAASPAVGQYAVSPTGAYTFNAGDLNAAIVITYSYVPGDIEQGVIELVGETYSRKSHIGINSQSVSGGVGEVVSYSQKALNDFAMSCLDQYYQRVAPI